MEPALITYSVDMRNMQFKWKNDKYIDEFLQRVSDIVLLVLYLLFQIMYYLLMTLFCSERQLHNFII